MEATSSARSHLRLLAIVAAVLWVGAWGVQVAFDLIYGSLLGRRFGWDAFGLGVGRARPPSATLNHLAMANLFLPFAVHWGLLSWAVTVCARGRGLGVPFNPVFRIAMWLAMAITTGLVLRLIGSAAGLGPVHPVGVVAVVCLILAVPIGRAARSDLLALEAMSFDPVRWVLFIGIGLVWGWLYVAAPGWELSLVGPLLPDWRGVAGYPALSQAVLGAGLAGLVGVLGRDGAAEGAAAMPGS